MNRNTEALCWLVLAALATGLTGCLARFDTTRPVTRHVTALGTTYDQDGRPFDPDDFAEKIDAGEAARADAVYANRMQMVGGIVSGTGGGLLGASLVGMLNGQEPQWALAGAGVAVVLASIPIYRASERAFSRAVDAHNRSLERPSKSSDTSVKPFLVAEPGTPGGAAGRYGAGLTVSF